MARGWITPSGSVVVERTNRGWVVPTGSVIKEKAPVTNTESTFSKLIG